MGMRAIKSAFRIRMVQKQAIKFPLVVACIFLVAVACGKEKAPASKESGGASHLPVTVVKSTIQPIDIVEESVGSIESRLAPTVSSEVNGRVIQIFVDNGVAVKEGDPLAKVDDTDMKLRVAALRAETGRLDALAANQSVTVQRFISLHEKKAITPSQMDDAQAQLNALREQIAGAKAQLAAAERELEKAAIRSPVSGKVQTRMISVGDFLSVGRPAFIISNEEKFQIHLPFPETVAHRIKPGQQVRISSPIEPDKVFAGTVGEMRPSLASSSRAVDVLVNVPNPGGWKSGASVNGSVLVDRRPASVVVPALSVVLRPVGEVVYIVEGSKTFQRKVTTGVRKGGIVEILQGLKEGETVVLDGSAFLSDGALVKIQESRQP